MMFSTKSVFLCLLVSFSKKKKKQKSPHTFKSIRIITIQFYQVSVHDNSILFCIIHQHSTDDDAELLDAVRIECANNLIASSIESILKWSQFQACELHSYKYSCKGALGCSLWHMRRTKKQQHQQKTKHTKHIASVSRLYCAREVNRMFTLWEFFSFSSFCDQLFCVLSLSFPLPLASARQLFVANLHLVVECNAFGWKENEVVRVAI